MKNPFVGLRPFRRAENDLFFGRARDIAILENLILAVPVLVVYAPSGTGKSSLLNAGVLPAIDEDPALISIMLNDPRADVLNAVRKKLALAGWKGKAESEDEGLAKVLRRHLGDTDRRVILVLDQFEERLKEGEKLDALYAEIARLANTRSEAATVIISIREDYLAGLEPLMRRVSGLLDASFRVPSLSREALSEAVYGPLKAVNSDVLIDSGLVDEVLNDLEREARHPESLGGRVEAGYFQIVWSHLWEKDATEPRHQITRSTYRREGGAAGILKSFVSRTISQLLPFEAEILRAVTRYLVLPTGAKVAMTVDDLIGLLRADDFTDQAQQLGLLDDKKITEEILDSVFHELTRTEAPLFRRVVRGTREEFELVHDLLGLILLQWRLNYKAREQIAAEQAAAEVFQSQTVGEFFRPELLPTEESGRKDAEQRADERVRRMTDSATKILTRYTLSLKNLDTVADAEEQRDVLKSAFSEVRTLASKGPTQPYELQMKVDKFAAYTINPAERELMNVAVHHPSREVRRPLQQQAYDLVTMRNRLTDRRPYSSAVGGGVAAFTVGYLASLVLVTATIFAARWVIEQVWDVPNVQYIALTLAVVACLAALMYAAMYVSAASGVRLRWSAVRTVLWPTDGLDLDWEEGFWKTLRRLAFIFVWWPIIFLVFLLGCFGGAALFQVAGWSPTAGFNLATLPLAVGAAIAYFVAQDL